MRIVPLEIGRLVGQLELINGEAGTTVLPVPAWLIEHPDGLVLFDTGMHVDLQHSLDRIGRAAQIFEADFPVGEELSARLAQRGIRPGDVTHIVLSHLHFDHVGGTAEIPDARVVAQLAEWEAGQDPRLIDLDIYNPDDYDLGHDIEMVDGAHDLFGDGLITCIPTPGHTVGHQSLRVELESGPVVLTSDCIYFESMLDQMRVPRLGHDGEQQLASMRELRALRDDEGCRLLFGHDAAQLSTIAEGLV